MSRLNTEILTRASHALAVAQTRLDQRNANAAFSAARTALQLIRDAADTATTAANARHTPPGSRTEEETYAIRVEHISVARNPTIHYADESFWIYAKTYVKLVTELIDELRNCCSATAG